MTKNVSIAVLLMARNARDKFGYYEREIQTLLRRGDLVLAALKKIPPGDYTELALFSEADEILADRARLQNCLANAKAELEVAERVAREDSIYVDENGEKNEFRFSN